MEIERELPAAARLDDEAVEHPVVVARIVVKGDESTTSGSASAGRGAPSSAVGVKTVAHSSSSISPVSS